MNAYNVMKIANVLNRIKPNLGDDWATQPEEIQLEWLNLNADLLEKNQFWTNEFTSIEDAVNPNKKLSDLSKLYDTYEGKIPTDARMSTILTPYKNGELTAKEINDYFNKTNQYREDELKAREYEAGRMRRSKEDLGFLANILGGEYSKQRYIDDPDASIFGKEGKFNPFSTEGQEELRDVILGGTGAVAEAMPGVVGVVGGPAIRAGRDAYHKYSDSPYKPQESIIKNALSDLAINAGVNYAPTAILNRANKMSNNIGKTARTINDALYVGNLEKETADIAKTTEEARKFLLPRTNLRTQLQKQLGDKFVIPDIGAEYRTRQNLVELNNYIRNLPDNKATAELKSEWFDIVNSGDFSDESISLLTDKIDGWRAAATKSTDPYIKKLTEFKDEDNLAHLPTAKKDYHKFYIERALAPKLSKLQKAIKFGAKNIGTIGEPAVRITANANTDVATNERPQIDWYKQNYDRDWRMGFKPKEDDSTLWKAYQEWKKEQE